MLQGIHIFLRRVLQCCHLEALVKFKKKQKQN